MDVLFNKIFPKLQAYFKQSRQSMEKEIMIICGYSYAVKISATSVKPERLLMIHSSACTKTAFER